MELLFGMVYFLFDKEINIVTKTMAFSLGLYVAIGFKVFFNPYLNSHLFSIYNLTIFFYYFSLLKSPLLEKKNLVKKQVYEK